MSARRALAWSALASGVAGTAAIVMWTAFGAGGEGPAERATAAPVSAVGHVAPRAHLVGDQVEATIDLTVNRALADPGSVDVRAVFRPYTRVGPVDVERHDADGVTRLRYVYALQCIDRACIDRIAGGSFAFAPAAVQYVTDSLDQGAIEVEWPEMTVGSRLAPGDVAAREFRADADQPPGLVYGVSPGLLGWLLAGAAAALVLAVCGIAFVLLRRAGPGQAVATDRSPEAVSPLERALARVESASAGDEPERRAALDELARTLEDDGAPELAPAARRIAWSRAAPDDSELRELLSDVRATRVGSG